MFHSLLISINADCQTTHTLMCNDLNEIESKPVPSTVIATIQSVRECANITFGLAIGYINGSCIDQ